MRLRGGTSERHVDMRAVVRHSNLTAPDGLSRRMGGDGIDFKNPIIHRHLRISVRSPDGLLCCRIAIGGTRGPGTPPVSVALLNRRFLA